MSVEACNVCGTRELPTYEAGGLWWCGGCGTAITEAHVEEDSNNIKLKIEITNVYADETVESVEDVEVPNPEGYYENGMSLDLDDWAVEYLLPFTGTGRTQPNDPAGYFVKVLECPANPQLVGYEAEWDG